MVSSTRLATTVRALLQATSASLLALCIAGPAMAQAVKGTVKEMPGRGTLEGITVEVLNAADSAVRRMLTKGDGRFEFKALVPGTYSLSLRALGFEPMMTTPFEIADKDQMTLDFEMIRTAVTLDTVGVKASYAHGVTPGRILFLDHYREGRGVFLSGVEIAASKKGIAEFVETIPGFKDFTGGNAADRSASACQTVNDELRGLAPSVAASRRGGGGGGAGPGG
jgi:hypothetical protein